jgi:TolA-binding protein
VAEKCLRYLLVTALAASLCRTCLADASTGYSRGMDLQTARQYAAAIQEYAKVLADPVLGPKACYQSASCYRELSNLDDALGACRRGLTLAGSAEDRDLLTAQMKDLRFAVAQALMEAKDWDGCEAQLRDLSSEYPEEAAWYRAKSRMAQGDWAMARTLIQDVVRTYPKSKSAVLYETYVAKCDYRQGKQDQAFSELAELARAHPDQLDPVVECAQILASELERAGKTDQSAGCYRQLIAADPTGPAVVAWKYSLAFQTYQAGQLSAARDAFESLCKDYTGNPWLRNVKFCLADCYARLGDTEVARVVFGDIVSQFPGTATSESAAAYLVALQKRSE